MLDPKTLKIVSTMRLRDQKASLTKRLRRYIRKETTVLKVCVEIKGHPVYEVIVTPNSEMLLVSTQDAERSFVNRVSIPRFSDWIVTSGSYVVLLTRLDEGAHA